MRDDHSIIAPVFTNLLYMKYSILGLIMTLLLTMSCNNHQPPQTTNNEVLCNVSLQDSIIDTLLDEFYNELSTQYDYVDTFITQITQVYIDSCYDIVASVAIAQTIIETGYGRFQSNNNYFGVKDWTAGQTKMTVEYINGERIEMPQPFKSYRSMHASVAAHARIMNNRYHISSTDTIDDVLDKLDRYATDPNYENKIRNIIKRYRLNIIDDVIALKTTNYEQNRTEEKVTSRDS